MLQTNNPNLIQDEDVRSSMLETFTRETFATKTLTNETFTHETYMPKMLMAQNSPLRAVARLAEVAAQSPCPIFIGGESGTGKELIAHFIHEKSLRSSKPFVAINCAAIPAHLIESELFGHRKGAFTGAFSDQMGKFQLAHGGTIFLDEIGDMPLEAQTRLLRVLQEKTITPIGSHREIKIDFRLICATHQNLLREIKAGRFRQDLFFRLNVVEIKLPPLRTRKMDIPILLEYFLSQQMPKTMVQNALENFPSHLLNHTFPGNIRELKNWADRYSVMHELGWGWNETVSQDSDEVTDMLPFTSPSTSHSLRNSRVSNDQIEQALSECGHHRDKASRLLGISRRALQYRLAKMAA